MSRGMYPPAFPPALTHMTAAMGGMGGMSGLPTMGAHIPTHTSADFSTQASIDSEKMRAAFLPSSLGNTGHMYHIGIILSLSEDLLIYCACATANTHNKINEDV